MSSFKAQVADSVADSKEPYRCYIGGHWVGATSGRTFDDVEPYSGRLFARVAAAGRAEARAAIEAAAAAFPAWAATTPAERARLFFAAANIVKRRRTEIAQLLARETGSTILFASFQQELVIQTLEQAAVGSICPRARFCRATSRGAIRSPCAVPWASSRVSRPGTAQAYSPGARPSRR
jgi:hypothetical protein